MVHFKVVILTVRNYKTPRGWICALTALLTFLGPVCLVAQDVEYRITFTDKGPDRFEPGSPSYQAILDELHPNALKRRELAGFSPIVSESDRPLYRPYLISVYRQGASPLLELRYQNTLVALLSPNSVPGIESLSFVKSVNPVSRLNYELAVENCRAVAWGVSANNLKYLGLEEIHNAGVFGLGSRICLIDNGFDLSTMPVMAHVAVERSFDFVNNDSVVKNEAGDRADQDGHGSLVSSVIGGWSPVAFTGTAPFSTLLLAKTESMNYERRIEEDNLCAAIEWAERNGADIATTSVVYYYFDSTEQPHKYSALDGRTAFSSITLNMAAERGMLMTVATGNSGSEPRTLHIPSDADSSIAVGGMVDADSAWLGSSYGPTADGRQKPDIMALGVDVPVQGKEGSLFTVNGTSVAAPQIAGVLAVLKQLHPDKAPYELKNALYSTAQYSLSGSSKVSRGYPNALKAARQLGISIAEPAVLYNEDVVVVVPVFSSDSCTVQLEIFDSNSESTVIHPVKIVEGIWYTFSIPRYLLTQVTTSAIITAACTRATPATKQRHVTLSGTSSIPCGMKIPFGSIKVPPIYNSAQATVWPIPANRGGTINVRGVDFISTDFELYDVAGIGVASGQTLYLGTVCSIALPDDISQGIHFLRIFSADKTYSIPIIVLNE